MRRARVVLAFGLLMAGLVVPATPAPAAPAPVTTPAAGASVATFPNPFTYTWGEGYVPAAPGQYAFIGQDPAEVLCLGENPTPTITVTGPGGSVPGTQQCRVGEIGDLMTATALFAPSTRDLPSGSYAVSVDWAGGGHDEFAFWFTGGSVVPTTGVVPTTRPPSPTTRVTVPVPSTAEPTPTTPKTEPGPVLAAAMQCDIGFETGAGDVALVAETLPLGAAVETGPSERRVVTVPAPSGGVPTEVVVAASSRVRVVGVPDAPDDPVVLRVEAGSVLIRHGTAATRSASVLGGPRLAWPGRLTVTTAKPRTPTSILGIRADLPASGPVCVAGVRGTEVQVTVGSVARVTTFEGEAIVGNPALGGDAGATVVAAGTSSSVTPDAAPSTPAAIPDEQYVAASEQFGVDLPAPGDGGGDGWRWAVGGAVGALVVVGLLGGAFWLGRRRRAPSAG